MAIAGFQIEDVSGIVDGRPVQPTAVVIEEELVAFVSSTLMLQVF